MGLIGKVKQIASSMNSELEHALRQFTNRLIKKSYRKSGKAFTEMGGKQFSSDLEKYFNMEARSSRKIVLHS